MIVYHYCNLSSLKHLVERSTRPTQLAAQEANMFTEMEDQGHMPEVRAGFSLVQGQLDVYREVRVWISKVAVMVAYPVIMY